MNEITFLKKLTNTSIFLLSESGAVLNPLDPVEEELLSLYHLEYPHEQSILYFTQNHNPAIQQDSLLFFWIVSPEYTGPMISRLYVAGPFTDIARTEEWFYGKDISHALSTYFTGLPTTAYNQMYHLADTLFQSLNLTAAAVASLYPDTSPAAPRSSYTNDSFALGSSRSYAYEKILVHGIQEGLDNDSINRQLSAFSLYRFSKDATFRSYRDYFIGVAHILSFSVCEMGIPEVKAFTICDHFVQAAEACRNEKQLDPLWNPLRDAFIDLVRTYRQHKHFTKPIRSVVEYIGKNVREKIILADMAAEIGYHPYYLSRLFQKEVGMTIQEYIIQERLYQSLFYLRFTNMDILGISSLVGFTSQSSFSTAFKKKYQVTPKQFRDQYR